MTHHDTRAALEDAIRADLDRFPGGHGILTDWIVIAAQESVSFDGTANSGITILTPRDAFPMHRALGLLDAATVTYRTIIASRRTDSE